MNSLVIENIKEKENGLEMAVDTDKHENNMHGETWEDINDFLMDGYEGDHEQQLELRKKLSDRGQYT